MSTSAMMTAHALEDLKYVVGLGVPAWIATTSSLATWTTVVGVATVEHNDNASHPQGILVEMTGPWIFCDLTTDISETGRMSSGRLSDQFIANSFYGNITTPFPSTFGYNYKYYLDVADLYLPIQLMVLLQYFRQAHWTEHPLFDTGFLDELLQYVLSVSVQDTLLWDMFVRNHILDELAPQI